MLQAVVAALDPQPAYLVNARGDRLAWNHAHTVLMGDPTQLPVDGRNLYWLLFTDPQIRSMVRDWRRLALAMLADYRAAALAHPADSEFESLTAALRQSSPEFRRWWDGDAIADFQPAHWQFDHPRWGLLQLDYTTMHPALAPESRLVVALPSDTRTAQRLAAATSASGRPRSSGEGADDRSQAGRGDR